MACLTLFIHTRSDRSETELSSEGGVFNAFHTHKSVKGCYGFLKVPIVVRSSSHSWTHFVIKAAKSSLDMTNFSEWHLKIKAIEFKRWE